MKTITRFNPTPTGEELHVGHLYMALVNATEAHHSGGSFKIRIDDTQEYWLYMVGKDGTRRLANKYCEQLSEFMVIDKIDFQSEMPTIRQIMGDVPIFDFIPKQKWGYESIASWGLDPNMAMYT